MKLTIDGVLAEMNETYESFNALSAGQQDRATKVNRFKFQMLETLLKGIEAKNYIDKVEMVKNIIQSKKYKNFVDKLESDNG